MTATLEKPEAQKVPEGSLYRQGDVVLELINTEHFASNILEGATKQEPSPEFGLVLRLGSATGHMHRFAKDAPVTLYKMGDKEYLSVTGETADLVHDEHDTIVLPQGTYEIIQQREYSPEAIRNVLD